MRSSDEMIAGYLTEFRRDGGVKKNVGERESGFAKGYAETSWEGIKKKTVGREKNGFIRIMRRWSCI